MESSFLKLPHSLRQLAVGLKGAQHRWTRYGADYRETRALLAASEAWTEDEIAAHHASRLTRLLREAKAGTDYYADALAGHTSEELDEIAAGLHLRTLPLLPKATLKTETARFSNRTRKAALTSKTSGSTGSPLEVAYDRASLQQRWAVMHHHRTWAGADPFARSCHFSGRQIIPSDQKTPPFWMANPFEHQLLISTYHLRPDHLPIIFERIAAARPVLLTGYSSAMAQVARYAAGEGCRLPTLRAAMTTAETLTPDVRAVIEEGLGIKVYDFYSASEGVPFLLECTAGNLHECPVSGIFELLDEDGEEVAPGAAGELVATSFVQWKTPLVRYRTGDWAERAPEGEACPCGRVSRYVTSVLGRYEDLVYTEDGRAIGMFSYRTLKYVKGLEEAQIVQESPSAFTVRAVLDGSAAREDVEAQVRAVFERVIGYPLEIRVEDAGTIPRGANGKFRSVLRTFEV